MIKNSPIISTSPEIMGGTPVFAGTRVPVQTLLDYLKATTDVVTKFKVVTVVDDLFDFCFWVFVHCFDFRVIEYRFIFHPKSGRLKVGNFPIKKAATK